MKLLYIGPNSGTSALRIKAFKRGGHFVDIVDPGLLLPALPFIGPWTWHMGALGLDELISKRLLTAVPTFDYDLAFIDPGNLVSKSLIRKLRDHVGVVVSFNLDNPFVQRDGARWRMFLSALPEYDLFVTPRLSSVDAAFRHGARHAVRLFQCADEVRDRPRALTEEQRRRFTSDVCFVGTWMPERGPFLKGLIDLGVPLTIYGTGWRKAPEYDTIRAHVREGHLEGNDYSSAILGAEVVLCLLSKGNLDQHTTRSVEAPSMGAVMCAPRTPDHLQLYEEGREAVFWSSLEECAFQCMALLADKAKARRIGVAARQRAENNNNFNERLLPNIIDALSSAP